jgi:hypothetical protein
MRSITTVGFMIVTFAACGSDRTGDVLYPNGAAATVTVSIPTVDPMTSAGDTRTVAAVAKDAAGNVIGEPSVEWSSSAPSVATVMGAGGSAEVTAIDDGTATITAASGGVRGTVTVTVRRRIAAIELTAPDSVLVEGSTTQLGVVGRDARQHPINGVMGVTFATSNPFSVMVSPTGLVTALFSSVRPFNSTITAMVIVDGSTLAATKRFDVASAAPPTFDVSALLTPEEVRPEPANSAGAGIIYLTRDGDRVRYTLLWSLLSGPAVGAQIHGPDDAGADTAPVLVNLPLGNRTNTNGAIVGSFSAADIRPQGGRAAISIDSLLALMATPGLVYVDLQTTLFAGGEIRGPIFPRS